MKSSQIAALINEIRDGVERSSIGKIYMDEKDKDGFQRMNNLAYQTYLSILNSSFQKSVDINMKGID